MAPDLRDFLETVRREKGSRGGLRQHGAYAQRTIDSVRLDRAKASVQRSVNITAGSHHAWRGRRRQRFVVLCPAPWRPNLER